MSHSDVHPQPGLLDDEVRHSIRVIKQQRSAKLLGVLLATVIGIAVLVVFAYLGLAN